MKEEKEKKNRKKDMNIKSIIIKKIQVMFIYIIVFNRVGAFDKS